MTILGNGRNNGLIDSTVKSPQAHIFECRLLLQQQPGVDSVKSRSRAIQTQVALTLQQKGCSDIPRKHILEICLGSGKKFERHKKGNKCKKRQYECNSKILQKRPCYESIKENYDGIRRCRRIKKTKIKLKGIYIKTTITSNGSMYSRDCH